MEHEPKTIHTVQERLEIKRRSPVVPIAGIIVLILLSIASYVIGSKEVVAPVNDSNTPGDVQTGDNGGTDQTLPVTSGRADDTPPSTHPQSQQDPGVDTTYLIVSPSKIDNKGLYHTGFLVSLTFNTIQGLTGVLDLHPRIACKQTDRQEEVVDETRSVRNFSYDCISDTALKINDAVWFVYSSAQIE